MDTTTPGNWLPEAEDVLRNLRDVQGVSILAEDKNIREVHILATPGRSAKQIVRDVETCLRTKFSIGIDHRVVSVAFSKAVKPAETPAKAPDGSVKPAENPKSRPEPAGEPVSPEPARAAAPAPAENWHAERPGPRTVSGKLAERQAEGRVRFASVNVYVSGPRVQAQVELRWKGVSRMGSASGWASRDSAHRLIAAATLAALQEFLEESWAMSMQNIEFVRFGREEVVIVGLSLITHRHEKLLAGCCPVEQDGHQAVVLATLAAVNRVVGGLPTREPTEYVLRPASRQEESGAKKF